jgi:hypothetical protein
MDLVDVELADPRPAVMFERNELHRVTFPPVRGKT